MKQSNQYLRDLFLDYVNNYVTIQVFSEHNGLDIDQAETLIDIGKALHEQYVKEHKEIQTYKRILRIKQLIDQGTQVYNDNTGYIVHKDSIGQYLITFKGNGYTIGLTDQNETKLNGRNFFYFNTNGKQVEL